MRQIIKNYKIHYHNHKKRLFQYSLNLGSSVLCLLCLFLACGHPPTQEVKAFVNLPKTQFNEPNIIHVSIEFNGLNGTFLRQNLRLGENDIKLPKGPQNVTTGMLIDNNESNEENAPFFVFFRKSKHKSH